MNEKQKKYTRFNDMHSGGGKKLSHNTIYIEAPEDEAVVIFENRFDRDPYHTTCSCCGCDYSIDEVNSVDYEFDRNPLVIAKENIKDSERPQQYNLSI